MKQIRAEINQKGKNRIIKYWNALQIMKQCYIISNDYSSLVSEATFKANYGEGLNTLTTKQMLQRLPIALAQVKVGNTSKNLLNEIHEIVYSLYRAKEITKILYNNEMNSIKVQNSKNSKISELHRLLLIPADKINLNRSDKSVALSILSMCYTWQNIKESHKKKI